MLCNFHILLRLVFEASKRLSRNLLLIFEQIGRILYSKWFLFTFFRQFYSFGSTVNIYWDLFEGEIECNLIRSILRYLLAIFVLSFKIFVFDQMHPFLISKMFVYFLYYKYNNWYLVKKKYIHNLLISVNYIR